MRKDPPTPREKGEPPWKNFGDTPSTSIRDTHNGPSKSESANRGPQAGTGATDTTDRAANNFGGTGSSYGGHTRADRADRDAARRSGRRRDAVYTTDRAANNFGGTGSSYGGHTRDRADRDTARRSGRRRDAVCCVLCAVYCVLCAVCCVLCAVCAVCREPCAVCLVLCRQRGSGGARAERGIDYPSRYTRYM